MHLHRLIYWSVARSGTSDDDVMEILHHAVQRNRLQGITGFLLFDQDLFLQLLEGPSIDVNEVFGSIWQDTRHSSVTVLDSTPTGTREFIGWDMGYRLIDKENETNAAPPNAITDAVSGGTPRIVDLLKAASVAPGEIIDMPRLPDVKRRNPHPLANAAASSICGDQRNWSTGNTQSKQ